MIMKTTTTLLLLTLALSVTAQNRPKLHPDFEQESVEGQTKTEFVYDVLLYSETFDSTNWRHTINDQLLTIVGNLPSGWSVVDNTGNNYLWHWSMWPPRGRFVSGPIIQNPVVLSTSDQTSGEKGFLVLESEWFNTTEYGQTANPLVNMDSYIQYGPIDASQVSAVSIRFEHFHRFCCASYSSTVGPKLQISNNGSDWTTFAVHQAPINAAPQVNPAVQEINISDVAAGQETVYFRIYHVGHSHYWWMVDDIKIFKPVDYDLRVINYWTDYSHGKIASYSHSHADKIYSDIPFFAPYHSLQPIMGTRATVKNFGALSLYNSNLNTTYFKGNSVIGTFLSPSLSLTAPFQFDSIEHSYVFQIEKNLSSISNYRVECMLASTETDQNPSDNLVGKEFHITKNLYGYANPDFASSDRQSPFSYVAAVDGDGCGIAVLIDPPTGDFHELVGLNIFIKSDNYNWEFWRSGNVAYFRSEVFEITSDASITDPFSFEIEPVATSLLYPVDSVFVNTWIYIPFDNVDNSVFISPSENGKKYMVILRMYTNNLRFFIGSDKKTRTGLYSNLLLLGEQPGWAPARSNISMELIVNQSSDNLYSNIHFRIQNQHPQTQATHPAVGATVTLYTNDFDMNPVVFTHTVNNTGITEFEGLRSGSYSYKVEYLGQVKTGSVTATGVDATKEILFNIVGVENQPVANALKLYPNPAQNLLTVESTTEPLKMEITNLLGQTLRTVVNPTASQTVDISGLATGVYVVTVVDRGNGRVSKMFVKQ
jgi:hypothetical protein